VDGNNKVLLKGIVSAFVWEVEFHVDVLSLIKEKTYDAQYNWTTDPTSLSAHILSISGFISILCLIGYGNEEDPRAFCSMSLCLLQNDPSVNLWVVMEFR
jgi:hypothetical protein